MTEAEVEKLRAGGISDAIILEMQKEESTAKGQAAPAAEASSELPEVDPNTPSRVYSQAQTNQTPTVGPEQSWTQTGLEAVSGVGGAVAPYVIPGVLTAAGLAGGSKLLGAAKTAADAYKTGVATAADTAQRNVALQEARMAERAARAGGQMRPVVPTTAAVPAGAVPTPGPVAPAGVPTAPAAPVARAAEQGIVSRAGDIVKRLALEKLAPMAANLAKGANAAALATYSSDLGPKTPQAGRMRGMEINPLTGAPWTPEQIAQYEANPAQYDAQMAPPQFRR